METNFEYKQDYATNILDTLYDLVDLMEILIDCMYVYIYINMMINNININYVLCIIIIVYKN